MAWRQLPDGTYFNPVTGDLRGLDSDLERGKKARSSAGSVPVSRRAVNPVPPLPVQKLIALPAVAGPQVMIDPKRDVLALNPFELGVGDGVDEKSDLLKKVMVVGGILGVAFVACKFA